MNFDATIHLGDLVVLVVSAAGFIALYGDFRVVKERVSMLWQVFSAQVRREIGSHEKNSL